MRYSGSTSIVTFHVAGKACQSASVFPVPAATKVRQTDGSCFRLRLKHKDPHSTDDFRSLRHHLEGLSKSQIASLHAIRILAGGNGTRLLQFEVYHVLIPPAFNPLISYISPLQLQLTTQKNSFLLLSHIREDPIPHADRHDDYTVILQTATCRQSLCATCHLSQPAELPDLVSG